MAFERRFAMGFYACLATVAFCSRAVHDFVNNLSYLARFAKQRVFIWLFKFDFGSFWDLIGIPMAFHEHLLWFPHGCALFLHIRRRFVNVAKTTHSFSKNIMLRGTKLFSRQ